MNEPKTLLNDEILHFLYKNAAFQTLTEQDQQQFFNDFSADEQFAEMMEMAIALQEMMQEVEATMPKLQDKDFLLAPQKQLLKERTVVDGNVYYVPFNELDNLFSPMIVALQRSQSIEEFATFCKGTIFPLFHLCATQKRDLVIVPFSNEVGTPLVFKNGAIDGAMFKQFMDIGVDGEAQMIPVMNYVCELFSQDTIATDRDLMLITDNQFSDFQALMQQGFEAKLEQLDIDVSVIAMSEVDFEVQPIPFAEKVFFANE